MVIVADDFFGFDAIPIGDQRFQVLVVNRGCLVNEAETALQYELMVFSRGSGDGAMKL